MGLSNLIIRWAERRASRRHLRKGWSLRLTEEEKTSITGILGRDDWWLLAPVGWEGTYRLVTGPRRMPRPVARWRLSEFPSCCGICVSHASKVEPEWQGKGLGTVLSKIRQRIAVDRGFGLLVCTDIEQNVPQRKLLKKNGWMDLVKFYNPNSGNHVFISAIPLNQFREDHIENGN